MISIAAGTATAIRKMFFPFTLSETNGRKKPNGTNMRKLKSSIVYIHRPAVRVPEISPKTVGTKLNPPEKKAGLSELYPTTILAHTDVHRFGGTRIRFASPVR